MKLLLITSFFLLTIPFTYAQTAWTWEVLDSMPERITNNAVAFGKDDVSEYVFSFGGLDSTKLYSGIHSASYRYTIDSNSWEEIDPLPASSTTIALGASTVKNKIYIIGGYHVFSSGSETSSNEVIRYNPETNAYLTNGTPIPIPIDDHVQCVWKDSLIFLITGWSNVGNVPNVQIYNPSLDSWEVGTSTPNTNFYKAFGASGEIIGDTIYYFGGATTGTNFPAKNYLRKGVINSDDPTEITWSLLENGPNNLYRSAALKHGNNLFWAGGSAISYNYNGIAYNGSGGVPPLSQIMRYDPVTAIWYEGNGAPYGVMDLRGIAQIEDTKWVICGGMEEGQSVSRQTYLLTYDPIVGGWDEVTDAIEIKIIDRKIVVKGKPSKISIFSYDGKSCIDLPINNPQIPENLTGFFIVNVWVDNRIIRKKIVV